jgi:hypothetical protein
VLFCRRQRRDRHQHVFLAHDQIGSVQRGQLETVTVGDGVGGAGFNAVAAEDAAVVIDVIDLGVALGRGDAKGLGVLGGLYINAVGGAGGGAEEAGHAFFQSVFVALQDMGAAIALLEDRTAQRAFAIGVIFHLCGREDLPKGDAHSLGDAGDVARNRHEASIRWISSATCAWRRRLAVVVGGRSGDGLAFRVRL